MEHVIVKEAPDEIAQAIEWSKTTPDGDLLDLDLFRHDSTLLLSARRPFRPTLASRMAYVPVQRPLMLENLIFRPGLSDRERALAISRMVEHSISEAYRRDVGELYFLCRHAETCAFAERHHFERIDGEASRLKLKVYRLNLREVFGE